MLVLHMHAYLLHGNVQKVPKRYRQLQLVDARAHSAVRHPHALLRIVARHHLYQQLPHVPCKYRCAFERVAVAPETEHCWVVGAQLFALQQALQFGAALQCMCMQWLCTSGEAGLDARMSAKSICGTARIHTYTHRLHACMPTVLMSLRHF